MSLFDAGGGVKFVQFSFRELIATPAGLSFVIETTPTLDAKQLDYAALLTSQCGTDR